MKLSETNRAIARLNFCLKPMHWINFGKLIFIVFLRTKFYQKVCYSDVCFKYLCGGVTASTWKLKQEEHAGENEDLDKNIQNFTI